MSNCSFVGIFAIVALVIILAYIIYEQNRDPVEKIIDNIEDKVDETIDDLREDYGQYYPWRMRRWHRGWPYYGRRPYYRRPVPRPIPRPVPRPYPRPFY